MEDLPKNLGIRFSSEDVETFWSGVARHHYGEANARFNKTHTQRFDIAIPRIQSLPSGKLLNLWSRQGEAIPYIRERFPKIELVNAEISRVMLEQAKERFPNELFVESNLMDICYADGYFDCILSLEMLEHSPCPQRTLDEMFRVLKAGGQLILTCPGALSEVQLFIADHFFNNHGEGPHHFPTSLEVKEMLKKSGFSNTYCYATLFIAKEINEQLNDLFERVLQWFPISEFGIRQLYEAWKR